MQHQLKMHTVLHDDMQNQLKMHVVMPFQLFWRVVLQTDKLLQLVLHVVLHDALWLELWLLLYFIV